MTFAVFLLVSRLVAGDVVSDDRQSVTFRLAGIDAAPGEVAVTLHARNATDPTKSLDFPMEKHEASILLHAGQWFVSASRPGYWSEPALVSVAGQPVDATLTLYRATPLRAAVTSPSPGTARTVHVHFSPSDATSGHPAASTTCPVADGRFDCDVPSNLYDLAFRMDGYASIYKWNVDLRGASPVDIGTLAFRAGSTLSGRVDIDDAEHRVSLDDAEVTLRNVVAGGRTEELRSRESITRAVAVPNKRGFFSFAVPPGTYFVSASAPGMVSEEREVTVTEGREVVLNEPLVLARPLTLTVNVRVPPEGANRAWKLALVRLDAETEASAEEVVSIPLDGICRFPGELPGAYDVELRLADSVWAAQRVELERDTTIDVAARVTKVRGSIHLGDELLAARVVFSESSKGIRVPVQSRDGTFLAFLPELAGDRWESVEIQSGQPWVKRTLSDVLLERDDDGLATMNIRLPAARIEGIVVDERVHPIIEGLVKMTGPDGSQQAELSDGAFVFHGLQPGRYSLTGSTRERESGDPVLVDIEGSDTQRRVVLKVAPAADLRGSVVSAWGPVIGASVFVTPVNHPHPVVIPMPVDTAGEFGFRLPPGTQDVLIGVSAPGFAFRMMRMPVPETSLDLAVDQNGGVLTIDGRVGARAAPLRPYVIHNGAILTAMTAAYLARARFAANFDERVHFEIASAEEGVYTLCLLSAEEERNVRNGARPPDSRCTSGLLVRHGALMLSAPGADRIVPVSAGTH